MYNETRGLVTTTVRCMRAICAILAGVLLCACGEHYDDLEARFGSAEEKKGEETTVKTVTLISTHRDGAFTLREVVDVRLQNGSISMSVEPPFGWLHKPISIPADAVAGCGKACFSKDRWQTELFITSTGTTIGFHNSNVIIDWCWKNRIPIIPGNIEREWKYKGGTLPRKESYSSQFESVDNYIYLAKQSCLGY